MADGEGPRRGDDQSPRGLRWWEDEEGQQVVTGDGMVIRREAADALASYLLPRGLFRRPRVSIPGNDEDPEHLIAAIRSGGGDGDALHPLRWIMGRIARHVGVGEATKWVMPWNSAPRPDLGSVYYIAHVAEEGIVALYGGRRAQPPAVLADTADLLNTLINSARAAKAAEALRDRHDRDARQRLGALRDREELPPDVRRAVDIAYALLAPQLAEM